MRPQSISPCWLDCNSVNITGNGYLPLVLIKTVAAKNSFHDAKKANRAVEINPGRANGIMMVLNIRRTDAPSIIAAYSNADGISANEFLIMKTERGRL